MLVMKTKKNDDRLCVNLNIKDRELLNFLKWKRDHRELSQFCNNSLTFYYDYYKYRKGFFIRMIEHNFEVIKYLLRKIGSSSPKNLKEIERVL